MKILLIIISLLGVFSKEIPRHLTGGENNEDGEATVEPGLGDDEISCPLFSSVEKVYTHQSAGVDLYSIAERAFED